MKNIYFFIVFMSFMITSFAQTPIVLYDFEDGTYATNAGGWWAATSNVENPSKSGINTSDHVLLWTISEGALPLPDGNSATVMHKMEDADYSNVKEIRMKVYCESEFTFEVIIAESSGGWQHFPSAQTYSGGVWSEYIIPVEGNETMISNLRSGTLIMFFDKDNYNYGPFYIDDIVLTPLSDVPTLTNAKVVSEQNIEIQFTQELANVSGNEDAFHIEINGIPTAVQSVQISAENSKTIQLDIADAVAYGDAVTFGYTQGTISSVAGDLLENISTEGIENGICKNAEVLKLMTTPVIDGETDDVWNLLEYHPVDNLVENYDAEVPSDADISGGYKIAYNDTALFILFEIKDDYEVVVPDGEVSPWNFDNFDVYMSPTKHGGNFDWGIDRNFSFRYGGEAESGISAVMKDTDDGYTWEIAIPFKKLSDDWATNPAPGTYIPVEFRLVDNDNGAFGSYLNQKFVWNNPTGSDNAYSTTVNFGKITLSEQTIGDVLGSDASLVSLSINNGILFPGFESDVFEYDVPLASGTTEVPLVTPTANDENATIVVTEAIGFPGQTIITVTAEDGTTTQVYTIQFHVLPSSNALLSEIEIDAGVLNPTFDSSTSAYQVELPFGTTEVPSLGATASDVNANVVVVNANELPGETVVTVTAEDGVTIQTYTVSFWVTTPLNDASLSALSASEGMLNPAFEATVLEYEVLLSAEAVIVPNLTATKNHDGATLEIINTNVLPGSSTVTVTAENGTSTRVYTVNYGFLPSEDASLSALTVNNGELDPLFDAETLSYDVYLAAETTEVPKTEAVSRDEEATIDIAKAESLPGQTTILVTAEDGITQKTYNVNYHLLPSTDASLSVITTASGSLSPSFQTDIFEYQVDLPSGSTEVPGIIAVASHPEANIIMNEASDLNGQTTFTVTAEDGTTTAVYTLSYRVIPSDDATLESLSVLNNTLEPTFDPEIFEYTVIVPKGSNKVPSIYAYKNDPLALAVLSSTNQVPGRSAITVTAENGLVKNIYWINFIFEKSDDATLSNLLVNGDALNIDFNPSKFSYTVELPIGTTEIPTVIATPSDDDAELNITNASSIPGQTVVAVTSEDGETTIEYTIDFEFIRSSVATLESLTVSVGTLDPEFNADVFNYQVVLPAGTKEIPTINAVTSDLGASIEVINAANFSEQAMVMVTAEDGVSTKTYRVEFIILPSEDASLISLEISEGTIQPIFDAEVLNYNVELEEGTESIPTIKAIAKDQNAKVIVLNANDIPGQSTITVTAEDGTTTRIYTVNISVKQSSDALLSELTVSEGVLSPEFTESNLNYIVQLPVGSTNVPTVAASAKNENAKLIVTDANLLTDQTTVTVTAEDGISVNVYTISFEVLQSDNAKLSDIQLSFGELSPNFDAATMSYTVVLPAGTETIPSVKAVANDLNAQVTINAALELPGQTVISVIAEDGETEEAYVINFTVIERSTDANLASLALSNGNLSPVFDAMTTDYHVVLSEGTVDVPSIIAIANDEAATVVVTDAIKLPGQSEVMVTAEDGTTIETYLVHFTITQPELYEIKFVVVDDNDEIISGAKIEFNGQIITTDLQGVAAFNDVETQEDAVCIVSKEGYNTDNTTMSVSESTEVRVKLYLNTGFEKVMNITFEMYPNPCRDNLTVKIMNDVNGGHICIYNGSGQAVAHHEFNTQETKINMSELPAGLYFIEVKAERMTQISKLIIE